jgi:amino acid transporter
LGISKEIEVPPSDADRMSRAYNWLVRWVATTLTVTLQAFGSIPLELQKFVVQCVQPAITGSLALVGLGVWQTDGFEVMVEFTAPVFWAFLFLVGVSLFVMRVKDPQTERPFKVPLYPLTPIIFCLTCAYLTYSSVTYAISKGAVYISLLVMAVGVVALAITHFSKKDA